MGIVYLLYPSNQASETNEYNRTSGKDQLTFSVSLFFIVTVNPSLITCYFQSSGGERALAVQAFWYTQGLELVYTGNRYSDFILL